MKQQLERGYTLSEAVITLGIIGVIAAILLPLANKFRPDSEKVQYLKTYDAITYISNELANNHTLFPVVYADGAGNNWNVAKTPFLGRAETFVDAFSNSIPKQDGSLDEVTETHHIFLDKNNNRWDVFASSNLEGSTGGFLGDITVAFTNGKTYHFFIGPDGFIYIPDKQGQAYIATRSFWRKNDYDLAKYSDKDITIDDEGFVNLNDLENNDNNNDNNGGDNNGGDNNGGDNNGGDDNGGDNNGGDDNGGDNNGGDDNGDDNNGDDNNGDDDNSVIPPLDKKDPNNPFIESNDDVTLGDKDDNDRPSEGEETDDPLDKEFNGESGGGGLPEKFATNKGGDVVVNNNYLVSCEEALRRCRAGNDMYCGYCTNITDETGFDLPTAGNEGSSGGGDFGSLPGVGDINLGDEISGDIPQFDGKDVYHSGTGYAWADIPTNEGVDTGNPPPIVPGFNF